MVSFATAALEDGLTDDTVFLYELVDVVRVFFLSYAHLLKMSSVDKVYQRKWLCLHACQRYAE
eukprot:CAMPEP_0194492900 /NCGR_PEP_ID=MMETSP0253-20130528/11293_1 /TAXON_ID=2966 /ORGANISM="Noctiluca scintillans" /LENGTH=62 /DNA_ID=CAMNT_0039333823 /DNA_START=6 /DNA_END=191 /DNA_ORIENTATION=-